MNSMPLNVMIVDDTITYRSILSRIMGDIPEVNVAGTASNGKIALTKLATAPVDLVLLDIEMPEMDGLETLKVIRQQYPRTGVIMVSGMNRSSADITIRALESGALDFIPKPDGDNLEQNSNELRRKLSMVVKHFLIKHNMQNARSAVPTTMATTSTPLKPSAGVSAPTPPAVKAPLPSKIDVLGIGVSTGGPNALLELIPKLPNDLNVPILLVQHMPPVFTASLAASLAKKSTLKVKEAEDGEAVLPNTVYIAPGGRHMTVTRQGTDIKIALNDNAPEHSCRPAVDVLFRSIATTYGKNILSVIMTGMGSDGALGVKALKQVGCYSLSQSEKSCVVYGMPRAVEDMKLADEVVDLGHMATRITELIKGRRS